MQESSDLNIPFLSAYLSGEISPGEKEIVEQWINARAGRRAWVDGLKASMNVDSPPRLNVAALRDRVLNHTYVTAESARETRGSFRASNVRYSIASITLGAIALLIGWQWSETRINNQLSSEMSVYTTDKGQRSTVTLPDESAVFLSVGSRLEVPTNYSMGNRTVRLNGEAFFTVRHHERKPFTVIAGASVTKVLGTRFLVRAYNTDSNALVAVQDGKVAVGLQVLSAFQQISVNSQGEGSVQLADTTQFSIANGILVLSDIELKDAIPQLNRWYDINIKLGEPDLSSRRISVELSVNSISDLIEMLEYSFNLRVVRKGHALTLYNR